MLNKEFQTNMIEYPYACDHCIWTNGVEHIVFDYVGPLTTSLCVRFTVRKVTMVGGVIVCLGTILTGLSPNLPITYITYGLISGKLYR